MKKTNPIQPNDESPFEGRSSAGESVPAEPGGAVICDHCGLPVPAGLVREGEELQFCCNGCRAVYEVIHGCGLERYYRLRRDADAEPVRARTTGRRYEELDDPAFRERWCRVEEDGSLSITLYLEGVHCAACVWLVEKLPAVVPGVLEARLDFRTSELQLRWDNETVPLSGAVRALDSLGYPAHPVREGESREIRRLEDRRFLIRLAVAGACAGNVMVMAFALYGGMVSGMEPRFESLFRWTSLGLALVALTWPGRLFFRGALAALRTRTANLDLPIALALSVGMTAGLVNTVAGRGEIYFDSITVLVFLLLVGRWLQHRQQRRANDAVELLFSLTPSSARRVEVEGVREVAVEALAAGDLVEVLPGGSVPVDGVVEEGRSEMDRSLLTGESRPAPVAPGDEAAAGEVNLSAVLRIRATAAGEETRVGRLMRTVAECTRRKAPLVQLADRLAGWFVVAVALAAAATLLFWWRFDPGGAVDHAVALLIVTCPCALGLATPLTFAVAIGRGAGRGILVKGGDTLERLAGRGRLVLDKTGTLTQGKTAVVCWEGDEEAKPLVAELEAESIHPVGKALAAMAADSDQSVPREIVSAFRAGVSSVTVRSNGISGEVGGQPVMAGSAEYLAANGIDISDWASSTCDRMAAETLTPVMIAVDGSLCAVAGIGDPLRDDAAGVLTELRARGWRPEILSGDHPAVAKAVGKILEFATQTVRGGVTPEEKLALIREKTETGSTVMVGDGVNDAAALAAASVGIAVHGGAEASLAAADVYLARPGLQPLGELIRASRRTLAAVKRALAVSLFYNVVAASLAAAGLINPIVAALLMPVSSFTVLTMALRARTFGE